MNINTQEKIENLEAEQQKGKENIYKKICHICDKRLTFGYKVYKSVREQHTRRAMDKTCDQWVFKN